MEAAASQQGLLKILFLTGSRTDPASRFRIWQFTAPLSALGHQVTVRVPCPARTWSSQAKLSAIRSLDSKSVSLFRLASAIWNLRNARSYDIIMMNRDLVPEPGIAFLEPWLARRNPRLIFDFDDAIHLGKRERKLRRILPRFAWITPGNAYLAEFARQIHKNVTIWPTVVNTDHYTPTIQRKSGLLRIGWSGSDSTAKQCLPALERPVSELAKSEKFEFIVICNSDPKLNWPGVSTRFVAWRAETEVAELQQLDIGLMPLRDEPFENGKCGLKAIQYMGCGVPALVSPVGVNKEIVEDGEHGFHCHAESDWVERLKSLIRDDKLRLNLGGAARSRAVRCYSIKSLLPSMQEVFKRVSSRS